MHARLQYMVFMIAFIYLIYLNFQIGIPNSTSYSTQKLLAVLKRIEDNLIRNEDMENNQNKVTRAIFMNDLNSNLILRNEKIISINIYRNFLGNRSVNFTGSGSAKSRVPFWFD